MSLDLVCARRLFGVEQPAAVKTLLLPPDSAGELVRDQGSSDTLAPAGRSLLGATQRAPGGPEEGPPGAGEPAAARPAQGRPLAAAGRAGRRPESNGPRGGRDEEPGAAPGAQIKAALRCALVARTPGARAGCTRGEFGRRRPERGDAAMGLCCCKDWRGGHLRAPKGNRGARAGDARPQTPEPRPLPSGAPHPTAFRGSSATAETSVPQVSPDSGWPGGGAGCRFPRAREAGWP